MMSHEDPHGPDDPEDNTGDEEGDVEARTAVEALLALNSPAHNTGYDDNDYMMEEIPEEYDVDKAGVVKEVYEVEDMMEGGVVKRERPSEASTDTTETDEESDQLGTKEFSDVNQSTDEGLKQLQAFVQATEGNEVASNASKASNHGTVLKPDEKPHMTPKSEAHRERSIDSVKKVESSSVKKGESSLQLVKTEYESSSSSSSSSGSGSSSTGSSSSSSSSSSSESDDEPPLSSKIKPSTKSDSTSVMIKTPKYDSTSVLTKTSPKLESTSVMAKTSPKLESTSVVAKTSPKLESKSVMAKTFPKLESTSVMAKISPKLESTSIMKKTSPTLESMSVIAKISPKLETTSVMKETFPKLETPSFMTKTSKYDSPIKTEDKTSAVVVKVESNEKCGSREVGRLKSQNKTTILAKGDSNLSPVKYPVRPSDKIAKEHIKQKTSSPASDSLKVKKEEKVSSSNDSVSDDSDNSNSINSDSSSSSSDSDSSSDGSDSTGYDSDTDSEDSKSTVKPKKDSRPAEGVKEPVEKKVDTRVIKVEKEEKMEAIAFPSVGNSPEPSKPIQSVARRKSDEMVKSEVSRPIISKSPERRVVKSKVSRPDVAKCADLLVPAPFIKSEVSRPVIKSPEIPVVKSKVSRPVVAKSPDVPMPFIKSEVSRPIVAKSPEIPVVKSKISRPSVAKSPEMPFIKSEVSKAIVAKSPEMPFIKSEVSRPTISKSPEIPVLKSEASRPIVAKSPEMPFIKSEVSRPTISKSPERPVIKSEVSRPIVAKSPELQVNRPMHIQSVTKKISENTVKSLEATKPIQSVERRKSGDSKFEVARPIKFVERRKSGDVKSDEVAMAIQSVARKISENTVKSLETSRPNQLVERRKSEDVKSEMTRPIQLVERRKSGDIVKTEAIRHIQSVKRRKSGDNIKSEPIASVQSVERRKSEDDIKSSPVLSVERRKSGDSIKSEPTTSVQLVERRRSEDNIKSRPVISVEKRKSGDSIKSEPTTSVQLVERRKSEVSIKSRPVISVEKRKSGNSIKSEPGTSIQSMKRMKSEDIAETEVTKSIKSVERRKSGDSIKSEVTGSIQSVERRLSGESIKSSIATSSIQSIDKIKSKENIKSEERRKNVDISKSPEETMPRVSKNIESIRKEETDMAVDADSPDVKRNKLLELKQQLDKVDLGGSVSISVVKTTADTSNESNSSKKTEIKSSIAMTKITERPSVSDSSEKDPHLDAQISVERKSSIAMTKIAERSSVSGCSKSSIAITKITEKSRISGGSIKESDLNLQKSVERKSSIATTKNTERDSTTSIVGNSVKTLDEKLVKKETAIKMGIDQKTLPKDIHLSKTKSSVSKSPGKFDAGSSPPSPSECDDDKSEVDIGKELVAFAHQSSIQIKNALGKQVEEKECVEDIRSEVAIDLSRKNSTEKKIEKEGEKDEKKSEVAVDLSRKNSTEGKMEMEGEEDKDGEEDMEDDEEKLVVDESKEFQEDRRQNEDDDYDDDRGEWEDAYPMPIQAEVVMSEGSESGLEYEDYGGEPSQREEDQGYEGELNWCKKGSEVLDLSEKENQDLLAYLRSFILGGGSGELVEYPPANNEVPTEGQDLTHWQLEGVHLPSFTPTVAPPPWLRLTIPPEGYRCLSCGDTFFIESSLVQHRERRSVWISLECGPCDAKLTFYNRCALKDHLRDHLTKGEEVDQETIEVRSLPLQLTRLLQPILVPIPEALMMSNKKLQRLKGNPTLAHPPVLKPIGRQRGSGFGLVTEDGKDDDVQMFNLNQQLLDLKRKQVRCYLCEKTYNNVRELMAHMRTNQSYSDQRVECRKCQLVLPSVCAAKAHILTHPPANSSNISVCPECGSRCEGPREFVHHLNTCGHQYRRSGVVCGQCSVCFFRNQEDFLTHWMSEHCGKSYECVVCHCTFESLVFHKCMSPGQQILATFRCLLTCPLCSATIQLHAQQEEHDTTAKVRAHLVEHHPTVVSRVHYVYKSKFCTNAFRSKDELRAHHDREHRRDNHYRTKTCTLHHEVLGYQHQYFSGQEPRNAFVTLPVALSPEELQEASTRDVPTVTSVIDKTLFPDATPQELGKSSKAGKVGKNKGGSGKSLLKDSEGREGNKEPPVKKDMDQLDQLRPRVCYRCGRVYSDTKDFRKHKRQCEGELAERTCLVCGVIAVGEDFARHCLGHIEDGVILCIYCNGTQFTNHTDLVQHFELHVHEQFSYPAPCAFCGSSLPDVATALVHINQEHNPFHVPFDTSEFECDRCGRRFHGERGLNVHYGRCTLGAAPPAPTQAGCRQCQVCHKALTSEIFGRHMVSHLEDGLLVCCLCDGRALPSSMALLHHLEEHAASPACPAVCPMCNLDMPNADEALTHLKEEHGFGNLLCSECDMHFNFTYQMQRHTDIVHKICRYAKRRYICWICRAYDHVKKETLMNHFRTVHGLDRAQVDEKVMIRTRGQGTMPTSQFIPTKPLGSKENAASSSSRSDADKAKSPKTSPAKSVSGESPGKQSNSRSSQSKDMQKQTPQTTPVKESPQKSEEPQVTPVKTCPPKISSPEESVESPTKQPVSSSPPALTSKKKDSKLKEKTKVLIKRLPDSILDEQSRSKKRRRSVESGEPGSEQEKPENRKRERKKKKKAFRCSVCPYGTNFREKLDKHMKRHDEADEGDGFVCRECGASFVVEPSLARHMFFAHKVKLHASSADENEDMEKGKIVKKRVSTDTEIKTETEDDKEKVEIKVEEEALPVPKRKALRLTVRKKVINVTKTHEEKGIKKEDTINILKPKGSITRKVTERKRPARKRVRKRPRRRSSGERNGVGKKETENDEVNGLGKRQGSEHIEEDVQKLDNQCVVCKEEFTNPVELYSHLRTHGMAFLKLGRKARPPGLNPLPSVRPTNE